MPISRFVITIAMFILMAATSIDIQTGTVIISEGVVVAIDSNGDSRELNRRSRLNLGDVVEVGDKALAQFRLFDSTIIQLSCNSSLKLVDDRFSGERDEANKSKLELLSGRLRTVFPDESESDHVLLVMDFGVRPRDADIEIEQIDENTFQLVVYAGAVTIDSVYGSIELAAESKEAIAKLSRTSAPELLGTSLISQIEGSVNSPCNQQMNQFDN